MENLKISYKDPEEITTMITYLESIYGKMALKCGKKHTYLEMDINLSNKCLAKICMSGYID